MPVTVCPQESELCDFALGRLSTEVARALNEHFERCLGCRSHVEIMRARTDDRSPLRPHTVSRAAGATRAESMPLARRSPTDDVAAPAPADTDNVPPPASTSPSPPPGPIGEFDGPLPSVEEFDERVVTCGAMSADELATFHRDLGLTNPPSDARELADSLVARYKLTRFQADAILQGRHGSLVLGSYLLISKIAEGGMGWVFKARHRRMQRIVAIKLLAPSMARSADRLARFQQEVEAAAKLNHPNIVAAYDADEFNGAHFLVMQYVRGQDLWRLITNGGPLSVERALDYALQTARGLAFAHRHGVVHRDIKPENLLVDDKRMVKILDMGLARLDHPSTSETGEGRGIMGTVEYMAPEQAIETSRADHRSDIYSLGCTFFYLLVGRPPFGSGPAAATLMAHQNDRIPSLRAIRPDVPIRIEKVLRRMVAKLPDDRYQSMNALVGDLEACLALTKRRRSWTHRSLSIASAASVGVFIGIMSVAGLRLVNEIFPETPAVVRPANPSPGATPEPTFENEPAAAERPTE